MVDLACKISSINQPNQLTQPAWTGLPEPGSNPRPLDQKSRALPKELPRPLPSTKAKLNWNDSLRPSGYNINNGRVYNTPTQNLIIYLIYHPSLRLTKCLDVSPKSIRSGTSLPCRSANPSDLQLSQTKSKCHGKA